MGNDTEVEYKTNEEGKVKERRKNISIRMNHHPVTKLVRNKNK